MLAVAFMLWEAFAARHVYMTYQAHIGKEVATAEEVKQAGRSVVIFPTVVMCLIHVVIWICWDHYTDFRGIGHPGKISNVFRLVKNADFPSPN